MTFDQLNLSPSLLRAIAEEGYSTPTPVQEQSIPHALAGKDLLACAQTGTGKTAAFALPILHHLMNNPPAPSPRRRTRALILTPTRELAIQIGQSFATYGKYAQLKTAVLYGGVNQNPQVTLLIHGVDIIIATPGRLLDLIDQGWADVKRIEKLVLDEADNMLDMGFILDIRKIISKTPQWRQTLLFSATMPDEIRRLANQILTDPVNIAVARVSSTAETVDQSVFNVSKFDKPDLLVRYIRNTRIDRMLVFTKTKQNADRVSRHLNTAGIRAMAIHADKTQQARLAMITAFKSDQPPILVATDIAARGLDIDNVSHVINFDVPHVAENYVHRIGRTGRAGASGTAVSLCDHEERHYWRSIERLTRQQIRIASIESIDRNKTRSPSSSLPAPANSTAKPAPNPSVKPPVKPPVQSHNRPAAKSSTPAAPATSPAPGVTKTNPRPVIRPTAPSAPSATKPTPTPAPKPAVTATLRPRPATPSSAPTRIAPSPAQSHPRRPSDPATTAPRTHKPLPPSPTRPKSTSPSPAPLPPRAPRATKPSHPSAPAPKRPAPIPASTRPSTPSRITKPAPASRPPLPGIRRAAEIAPSSPRSKSPTRH